MNEWLRERERERERERKRERGIATKNVFANERKTQITNNNI
jgi:hypothetical protein